MTDRWQLSVAKAAAGDGPGEDRWMFHEAADGSAWAAVIDGASSTSDAAPTGGDYAASLCANLVRAIESHFWKSPQDVLREAIDATASDLELPKASAPSAAVSLVRWSLPFVDIAVLGDVTTIIFDGRTEHVVRDTRLSRIAPELRRRYKEALRDGRSYGSEHQDLVAAIRRAERLARNQVDGYWIAADAGEAAARAVTLTTEAERSAWVVLASDGAAAAIKYQLFATWTELSAMVDDDPDAFIRQLRDAENADGDGQRYPRSKRHDDATVLLLRRTPSID